jgi:hypothetical protein
VAGSAGVLAEPAALLSPVGRALDYALRAIGLVVALAGGFVVAAYGAFLVPFRVHSWLVPISLVIAVVGIIAVTWFALVVTRSKILALAPAALWLVLSFAASSKTSAGSLLLIQQDWVASVYLVIGPVAIAFCVYQLFLRRPEPTASGHRRIGERSERGGA